MTRKEAIERIREAIQSEKESWNRDGAIERLKELILRIKRTPTKELQNLFEAYNINND